MTPAVLLLSYGNFEAAFLPGAFILLAAAALRLSYFSTFGLSGSSEYTGLALDNNSILLVFLFAFESTLGTEIFSAVLYVSCLGLAALNVSQIKTPKSALEQLRGSDARLDSVSQGRRGIGVRITLLRASLIPPTLSDIMIHPYSNETQTRWDHGDFKVQLIQPNNTRPMGFCDGSAADLAELQQMAESEGADEMRIEKKSLKTGREIWTLHGGG